MKNERVLAYKILLINRKLNHIHNLGFDFKFNQPCFYHKSKTLILNFIMTIINSKVAA